MKLATSLGRGVTCAPILDTVKTMARHAYVSRRDGRYLFRARLPAVERSAFQETAFIAQYAVRILKLKPNEVVPGWDEHLVALVRENSRASNTSKGSWNASAWSTRSRTSRWCELTRVWKAVLSV
ncbi:hypothetical protein A5906_10165 [Bradyrhizobium sacchari]|uniref:Uncharacterized protein n=1 Tax=Bradyrhizobium sacchari TaxID=1399419 RepID=A0A560JDC8_9BRAD|nr:hypothetical protein A5906_10165 [Bradyrhizobium sacchari]TWB49843.1 hypothetical protein FBZ94_112157 [Bradyrhizobium sacchari]TWB68499.1 hypothetical protein FBZ95_11156 [Bradyrhizobium sacchari]